MNFGLIGVGGYIAPRHLKAIKDTNNHLACALDKNDSVGIMDSYFPHCDFFTEFERFDRYVYKLRQKKEKLDYMTICTPNYLHDAHSRYALRNDIDVICEKPLVINPWNLDGLEELENQKGRKVNTILQLREHDVIKNLKEEISKSGKRHKVKLNYITTRGNWYHVSWKGDLEKSGGLVMNIGIHFFDMLMWIFGECHDNIVTKRDDDYCSGKLALENADVEWELSVNEKYLPDPTKRTFRSIQIDGNELEFSEGFTELHTVSYQQILKGKGYGIKDIRPSIDLAYDIRTKDVCS